MLFANVAYDLATWLAVPTYWGPETWESPQAWGAETARERWLGNKPRRHDVARTELVLTSVAEYYGFPDPAESEVVGYAHMPHPAMTPHVVKVWVDQGEPITLDDLRLADDPNAVEPPIVEEFPTAHLGRGIRVFRYLEADLSHDESGELSLYAMVHYAFVIPAEDAVLVACATCPDLGRLTQAMDDIDAFVREIRWAYEPQDLAGGGRTT